MTFTTAACNIELSADGGGKNEEINTPVVDRGDSRKLNILRSDLQITPEEKAAKIKAEYLLKNGGYSDNDEVVAIIELEGDAIIDGYLGQAGTATKSVAEYAASQEGRRQAERIAVKQQALITQLKNKSLIYSVNYTYNTITNAIAVTTTYGNFKTLEKYPGISNVALSDTFNRLDTGSTDASAIVNAVDVYDTGIYDASSVNFTGEGTAVAVLDSGFDCSHSVFDIDLTGKELFLDEAKVSDIISNGKLGKLLNATDTTPNLTVSDVYESDKIPFAYDYANKDADVFPFDSEHGTHVAGIIGGLDESKNHIGIAPDTQLVLMKVFPDVGQGAENDDILAALEDAVLLGVDAINMSLGSACGFAREVDEDWTNEVYDNIKAAGVSLIASAGNNYSSSYGGEQGNTNFVTNPDSGIIGSPGSYDASLAVASISGVKSKYLVANDNQVVFFNESNSIAGTENDFFGELYKSLGKSEDETVELDYVTVPGVGLRINYSSIDVQGKIALVRRGDNTFEDKALQAKNAGAIACIIYNNIDGDILMSMGKSDHIPTISISKDAGTILANRSSGKLLFDYGNQAGPFMSDFSSWGPLPNLELKPEITAHGGKIRSSVPGGEFAELSGTSMSSPNLCGIVVLIRQFLKEKYSDYSAKQITELTNQMLMSTATIILNEEGIPYSPRKQGAGLASLYNVVNSKAYVTVDDKDGNLKGKSKIELYDDPGKTGVYDMTINVVNPSNTEVKYNLSLLGMSESVSTSDSRHVAETGHILGGGITATKKGGEGSVVDNVVTVAAGGSLKIAIKYTLTAADKEYIENLFPFGMYVDGFVKLDAIGDENDDIDLSVPFLAFYGDWRQAPLFDKTFYEVEAEAHDASINEEDKLKADYYATTPYGSYYYNYMIPLGQYLYDIDTVAYDPIPATEDHIAISDYLGTVDGIQVVYAGLLRGAKQMDYTITDKVTGEVVYSATFYNAHRAFSQGGSPIPGYEYLNLDSYDLGLINNRQYEFKMQGYIDYGDGGINTNVRNSFSFDFYLDDEAPILKEATYEKVYDRTLRKDRYYINLTVYDNHYVQSINPIAFHRNEETGTLTYTDLLDNPIPVYSQMGKDNKVRIEITEYLDNLYYDGFINNALGFSVDDYALNTNVYICVLPGTDTGEGGELKFTSDGQFDSSVREILYISTDEVADLTQYLASTDPTADENREYLKYFYWTSSNEKVATVREGQVKGIGVGSAEITVRDRWNSNLGNIISATITIRVSLKATGYSITATTTSTNRSIVPLADRDVEDSSKSPLESLRFVYFDTLFAYPRSSEISEIGATGNRKYISSIEGMLDMYPGEQIKLTYDVEPWYVASKYTFSYRSSNEAAVKIDSEGVLTAVKEGVATITLSASGSNISATLRVNIKSPFVIDEARTLIAYKGYGDENGVVEIPDDEGILYIGPHAFTLFTYDDDVKLDEDDYYANRIPYGNENIKKVIIPKGVIEIQQHAFNNCTSLEEVVLPSTIKFIREFAFYKCEKLKTINLYEDHGSKDDNVWVEAIGAFAFSECAELNNIDLSHVYSIGDEAFSFASSLSEIDITALRNTGVYAFADCENLTRVTMDPDGKTKLAEAMFYNSGLTSIDIYEKKSIPAYCFADCTELLTVNIHNALLTIGEGAFLGCSLLRDLTLPDSSVKIEAVAFEDCAALEILRFQANTQISLVRTIVYDEEGYIYYEINSAFSGSNIKQFIVDPGNSYYKNSSDGKLLLNGAGDTVILAATGAKFGDYTLPSEIARVGAGAFAGTDITVLTISNKDLIIEEFAFAECFELVTVNFPEASGSLEIGDYAFYTIYDDSISALTNLNHLDTVKKVGEYAFARTAVEVLTIGADAVYGDGVFYGCTSLTKVTVGVNTTFGYAAFGYCELLEEVEMPEEGEVFFGPACFEYCDALSIIDLSNLSKIEFQAFFGCLSLTEINLANATEIDDYAFAYCSSLSSVSMPKVVRIGNYAFSGDIITILDVAVNGNLPNMGEWVLSPIFENIVLPATLKELGEGAFAACWMLKEITIPSGITEIADYVFSFCTALESVTLPSSVERIGESAFIDCEALTTINLGKVKLFDANAFMYDDLLETLDLTEATAIGYGAFAGSVSVTGKIVANKLEVIGDLAFAYTGITEFEAAKLAYIGTGAFNGSSLKEFVFSTSLEYVGTYAFAESVDLKNFYFGSDKSNNGKINDYAQLVNGVLYTTLPNGKLELSSVPAGMDIEVLEVVEGTVKIAMYAGGGNVYIEKIVLPDSMQVIGNYAFFNYLSLKTVEFKSAVAPAFENYYTEDTLSKTEPGYKLLHAFYSIFNWELCYYNIIDFLGARPTIEMILPANKDISGYDSIVYEGYFGKVEDATRSGYVAMQSDLRNFVDYAVQLIKIGEINLNHEKLISAAVAAMNAVTQDYKQYGYTKEQWNSYVTAVTTARARLLELKLESASKAARDVQARINQLPDKYRGEEDLKAFYEQLTRDYNLLSRSDKEALDITRYTAFRASFDTYGSGDSEGGNPANGINALAIVLPVVGGVVLLGAAITVFLLLRKKKNNIK